MNTFSPAAQNEKSVIILTPETNTVELMEIRIHQQSELIAMMKKRSDGMILELNNCDKKIKKMEELNKKLETSSKHVQKDYETLKERFDILSYNHDEMIKLKNEYKTENQRLLLENQSMVNGRSDNMTILAELEAEKIRLQNDFDKLQTENKALHYKINRMEADSVDQKKNAEADYNIISSLQRKIKEMETEIKDIQQRFRETEEQLKTRIQKCIVLEVDNSTMKESLRKTNNLLAVKTDENTMLEQKVKKLEQELEQLRMQSEKVDKDVKVQKLVNELSSIRVKLQKTEQEFSAYQEFSTNRLKEEKALNEKLRHLAVD